MVEPPPPLEGAVPADLGGGGLDTGLADGTDVMGSAVGSAAGFSEDSAAGLELPSGFSLE